MTFNRKIAGIFGSILALALATHPVAAAEITTYTNPEGDSAVMIVGDIEKGDAAKFRRIAGAKKTAVVMLSSYGGELKEALDIGEAISAGGYVTAVPNGSTCASACALVWLSGKVRAAEKGSKIGFHAGYTIQRGKAVESGVANAMVGRYLTLLNLPVRAVIFATSASPDSMAWIDTATPGIEGIPYELWDVAEKSGPTTADKGAEAPAMAQAVDRPAKDLDNAIFGKWQTRLSAGGAMTGTQSRDEKGAMILGCAYGRTCKFYVSLDSRCDVGDVYELTYSVEGYEDETVDATCDANGETLILAETAQIDARITHETAITFHVATETGDKSITFPLIGYTQAGIALTEAGYIQDGMGADPAS